MLARADPQVDANVLIRLLRGEPEFLSFAARNRHRGLSYNYWTRQEFLATARRGTGDTRADLRLLEQRYGARLITDIGPDQILTAAFRLRSAFSSTDRILDIQDSRVATTAWLRGELLATGDLRFYKRLRDLGIDAEFIGATGPSVKAERYVPSRVQIP